MKEAIRLLTREVFKQKYTLEIIHLKLVNMVDIQEKNEYINKLEDTQSDINSYNKAINVLEDYEEE